MITVQLEPSVEAVLSGLGQVAEIRDAQGKLLGYFLPPGDQQALLYLQAVSNIDPAEMKRRKDSGATGYTTPEVLERIRSPGSS